jgi:hypothetical protein
MRARVVCERHGRPRSRVSRDIEQGTAKLPFRLEARTQSPNMANLANPQHTRQTVITYKTVFRPSVRLSVRSGAAETRNVDRKERQRIATQQAIGPTATLSLLSAYNYADGTAVISRRASLRLLHTGQHVRRPTHMLRRWIGLE